MRRPEVQTGGRSIAHVVLASLVALSSLPLGAHALEPSADGQPPSTPPETPPPELAPSTTATVAETRTPTVTLSKTSTIVEFSREWIELQPPGTATVAPAIPERPKKPKPPKPGRPRQAIVRVAYTGGSAGIGAGRYDFQLPERLRDALESLGGKLTSVTPYHGALAQGLSILVSSDRSVRTLVDLIREGNVTCENTRRVVALPTPRERLLIELGDDEIPAWLDRLMFEVPGREYRAETCTTPSGKTATLYAPALETEPIRWNIEAFAFRLALHVRTEFDGRESSLEMIGVPTNESPRKLRLLAALAASERTLYVDAGSFIDGASSFREGELSAHRTLGLDVLQQLGPAALVPGETELINGARPFLAEVRGRNLAYVATNWITEDTSLQLPEFIQREIPTPEGVVRVAFLGIVDPRLREWSVKLISEGVIIEDPITALRRVVRKLEDSSDPPDLIIALTTSEPSVLATIKQEIRGVDLILGEVADVSERVKRVSVELVPEPNGDRPIATALPILGVASAELRLVERDGRWALGHVRVEPYRVAEQMEPDPAILGAIARTRAQLYPELDRPLISQSNQSPLARISTWDWRQLVCAATLRFTDADVVFLPDIPDLEGVPGPLTELLLSNRLATFDRLEAHYIPGSRILELLRNAADVVDTACGARIGPRADSIRGRGIDPERMYKVVSTDRGRVAGFHGLFAAAYSPRALDPRGPVPVVDDEGRPVSLRRAVLDAVREERDTSGREYADADAFLRNTPWMTPPYWFFRVSKLSTRLERFQGTQDPSFSRIPETLATSPSSLTLTTELDAALAYDSAKVLGDLRVRAQYGRISIERAGSVETQEPADDLRVSSSASLPGVSAPIVGPIRLMPFTELLLDSEFTPIEDSGGRLPRQADLSLTLGGSFVPVNSLRSFRLGAFVLQNLGAIDRLPQLGGRASLDVEVPFGPDLKLQVLGDATLFANTPRDSASDLRFKALLETRLMLPVARYLDASLFVRGFALQGRVPETRNVGLSFSIGFALDLHGTIRL